MSPRLRTPVVVIAAALSLGLLTGCASSSEGGASAPSAGDYAMPQSEVGRGDSGGVATPADQALVITGNITITTDDPIEAAEEAGRIVAAAGGRVDARNQTAPRDGDSGSASLQLRIPAAALDGVRADLAKLGRVDETNTESINVGQQQRDLETRITTLRASIARYTGWLATAETTKDLIELESAISGRQIELESLEAQQRALTDQVSLSTIDLYLYSESTSPTSTAPSDFGSALVVGWNAFVGFWVGATVVVGVLLPWIVLIAVITGGALWGARALRARRAPAPLQHDVTD